MTFPRIPFTSPSALPAWARTAGRVVRVKVIPRPTQISESKNILSALQKYGRVVYFQSLRYEPEKRAPNTIVALFAEEAPVNKILKDAEFTLEMGSWGYRKIDPDEAPSAMTEGGRDQEIAPSPASKTFHVKVDRSDMDLHTRLQRQLYFSSFETDRTSIMFHDLQKRIPVDAMADCQLKKGELPRRKRALIAEAELREQRGPHRRNVMEMWTTARAEAD